MRLRWLRRQSPTKQRREPATRKHDFRKQAGQPIAAQIVRPEEKIARRWRTRKIAVLSSVSSGGECARTERRHEDYAEYHDRDPLTCTHNCPA